MHAADGAPMPTKHTSVERSARAAAMVITSPGVGASVASDAGAAGRRALLTRAQARSSGRRESTLSSIQAVKVCRSRAMSSQAM